LSLGSGSPSGFGVIPVFTYPDYHTVAAVDPVCYKYLPSSRLGLPLVPPVALFFEIWTPQISNTKSNFTSNFGISPPKIRYQEQTCIIVTRLRKLVAFYSIDIQV